MTYQHPHDRDDGRSIEELCKPLSATVMPISVTQCTLGQMGNGRAVGVQRRSGRQNIGNGGGWRNLPPPGPKFRTMPAPPTVRERIEAYLSDGEWRSYADIAEAVDVAAGDVSRNFSRFFDPEHFEKRMETVTRDRRTFRRAHVRMIKPRASE